VRGGLDSKRKPVILARTRFKAGRVDLVIFVKDLSPLRPPQNMMLPGSLNSTNSYEACTSQKVPPLVGFLKKRTRWRLDLGQRAGVFSSVRQSKLVCRYLYLFAIYMLAAAVDFPA
jgi:hypothetical protein